MKNGSKARVSAGRARIRPHAFAREPCKALAALLGYHPTSFAMERMRSRVPTESPGRPFNARETAPRDTPAFRDVDDGYAA